jgi:NADH-quinone oxidoreductase subunit L
LNPAIQHQLTSTIFCAIAAALSPFAAFLINICLPGKQNKFSGWLSVFAILVSVVLSVFVFSNVWNGPQVDIQTEWFTIGATHIYAGIMLNNLSALMLLLVSLIALPVHIYSTAYMKDDAGYKRYFTCGLFIVPAYWLLVYQK